MKNYIHIANKKYSYTIDSGSTPETSWIVCPSANIDQEFLKEDVVDLILDLENLIYKEQDHNSQKDQVIRFRVSGKEKLEIQERTKKEGYENVSSFIKDRIF